MIEFLDLNHVLYIHEHGIAKYGGSSGIRDIALLESAVHAPQASFDNKFLHKDIYEMAAVYAFHICKNHPFVDGNKRTAFGSMYSFLRLNNYHLDIDPNSITKCIMDIASGNLSREEFAKILKKYTKKIDLKKIKKKQNL